MGVGARELAVGAVAGGFGLSGEEYDGLFSASDFGGSECGVDDFVVGRGEMEEVGHWTRKRFYLRRSRVKTGPGKKPRPSTSLRAGFLAHRTREKWGTRLVNPFVEIGEFESRV